MSNIRIFLKKAEEYQNLFRSLLKARKNLIAVWPKEFFSEEFIKVELFFGYSLFIVNNPEDVRIVMVDNASGYIKSKSNVQTLKPLLGNGLFVSEGALWRRQRKIAAPSTHGNMMSAYSDIIIDETLKFNESIGAQDPEAFDVSKLFTILTADIISRIMFGYRLGHDGEVLYRAFQEYQASHGRVHLSEFLRIPEWVPRLSMLKGRRAVRRVDEVLFKILHHQEKSAQSGADYNLLQMLLDYRDEKGAAMEPQLVRDEMVSIFLAGHETTALTLGWVFHLLEKHPEIEKKLHSEIDQVLSERTPTFVDFPKLVYTKAVIEETLRLYPPVHVFSREAVEEDTLHGTRIPLHAFIIISSWLLHRHEKYWENPDSFDPERFLPENADKIIPFSYIPFGAGPRVCLGKNLGIMESVLILAIVARKFKFRSVIKREVQPVGRMTLRPDENLHMKITVRIGQ
jgi:cytochrome P450